MKLAIPGKCHPLLFNPSGGVHEAAEYLSG